MPVSILLQNAAARRPSILPEAKSRRRADSFRPRNESYLAEKLAY